MQQKKKPRGKPFKPGQSGNPGGRPPLTPEVVELRELARQHSQEAFQAVLGVMKDKSASPGARLSAAEIVLDRGHGRAPQNVEVSDKDGNRVDLLAEGILTVGFAPFKGRPSRKT